MGQRVPAGAATHGATVKNFSYRHYEGKPESKRRPMIGSRSSLPYMVLMLLLLQLTGVHVGFAASEHIAESATGESGVKFERNLPIVFLEAKEEIVSERRVPCSFRMLLESASA